jgi:hypothetical protein
MSTEADTTGEALMCPDLNNENIEDKDFLDLMENAQDSDILLSQAVPAVNITNDTPLVPTDTAVTANELHVSTDTAVTASMEEKAPKTSEENPVETLEEPMLQPTEPIVEENNENDDTTMSKSEEKFEEELKTFAMFDKASYTQIKKKLCRKLDYDEESGAKTAEKVQNIKRGVSKAMKVVTRDKLNCTMNDVLQGVFIAMEGINDPEETMSGIDLVKKGISSFFSECKGDKKYKRFVEGAKAYADKQVQRIPYFEKVERQALTSVKGNSHFDQGEEFWDADYTSKTMEKQKLVTPIPMVKVEKKKRDSLCEALEASLEEDMPPPAPKKKKPTKVEDEDPENVFSIFQEWWKSKPKTEEQEKMGANEMYAIFRKWLKTNKNVPPKPQGKKRKRVEIEEETLAQGAAGSFEDE